MRALAQGLHQVGEAHIADRDRGVSVLAACAPRLPPVPISSGTKRASATTSPSALWNAPRTDR
jgi:hypothetical protein